MVTKSWTGSTTGGGLWDIGSNWSTGSVPNLTSDVVTISATGTYQVSIGNGDPAYTIRNIALGDAGSAPTLVVQGQLNVQKLISLTNGSNLDVGSSGTVSGSRLAVGTGSTVVDLGTLNISGALAGSGTVAVSGGQLFANTIAGNNNYTLTNNASMTISNSVSSSGGIVFGDGTPDTLNLDTAGSSFSANVAGFGGGDMIDIGSLAYSSGYTVQYSGNILTIDNGATTLFTFNSIDNPGLVSLVDDGAGGTEIITCFLAGTRIRTEHGETAVEHLAAGDVVATLVGGVIVHQPIKWLGSRHLGTAMVRKTMAYPIRILAHAFAQGVPRRDLLVTPEHCVFLEGCLIPARMLVNGGSIVEDRALKAFGVYHIELETHGVLLAEGLAAESYLDTGNRGLFSNAGVTQLFPELSIDPSQKSWDADACARLATDRETVEPIWARLADRALHLGLADRRHPATLLDDPQLRILLNNGHFVAAHSSERGRHLFQVPAGAKPLRLVSRAAVPASVIGPFVDDRRRLGVQVRSMALWNEAQSVVVNAEDCDLPGWHAAEQDVRWTNGDATVKLPVAAMSGTFLEVHVVGTLPYRQDGLALLAA